MSFCPLYPASSVSSAIRERVARLALPRGRLLLIAGGRPGIRLGLRLAPGKALEKSRPREQFRLPKTSTRGSFPENRSRIFHFSSSCSQSFRHETLRLALILGGKQRTQLQITEPCSSEGNTLIEDWSEERTCGLAQVGITCATFCLNLRRCYHVAQFTIAQNNRYLNYLSRTILSLHRRKNHRQNVKKERYILQQLGSKYILLFLSGFKLPQLDGTKSALLVFEEQTL